MFWIYIVCGCKKITPLDITNKLTVMKYLKILHQQKWNRNLSL